MYNFGSIPFFASNNNLVQKNPSGIPSCTSSPSLYGEPYVGSTISISVGVWTNEPTRFSYAWYFDNRFIGDSETLELIEEYMGGYVKCIVFASNYYGMSSASTRSVLIL